MRSRARSSRPSSPTGPEQSEVASTATVYVDAGPELSRQLTELGAELGVTLNTVVQTAWGILLSRMLGRDDVVFGATVSGRPAELESVESMVGLLDHRYLGLSEVQ